MNTIYLLINKINGKKYIGFTSYDVNKRFSEHRSHAKSGSKYFLHQAIRKYGWNSFQPEILYMTDNLIHAKEMERFFIAEHKSFGSGYNMTPGGDGGLCTPEKAANISRSKKGKSNPHMLGIAYNRGKRWFTDGFKNILSFEAPIGFKPGRIIIKDLKSIR